MASKEKDGKNAQANRTGTEPMNGPSAAGINDRSGDVRFSETQEFQAPSNGVFAYVSPVTLAIICGCTVASIVICVVALLWIRSRRRRQKLLTDLSFDDGCLDSKITKSAPASRSGSPKSNKRMSCPDALSVSAPARSSVLVRSMTADRIPDITMSSERVQPWGSSDKKKPTSNNQQRTNSLTSTTSENYSQQINPGENETKLAESLLGRLWYSVRYDATAEELKVNLVKVDDLPGRNNNLQLRDPFVKIFLLPDDRACQVSKVKKNTLCPVFYETHTFKVLAEDVKKRTLRFSVYDVDKRRVRHSLGHVMANLKGMDLSKGDVIWSDLESTVQATTSLGELQLSLIYVPSSGKIKVAIHRAKNLNYVEDYPDMEVYIRGQLFYGHKCHRIKRTLARPGGADVTFNESLSFTVSGKQMDSCNLMISVMLTSAQVYTQAEVEHGRVVVGPFMYARGDELLHWQEMVTQPKIATTRWHTLTTVTSSP